VVKNVPPDLVLDMGQPANAAGFPEFAHDAIQAIENPPGQIRITARCDKAQASGHLRGDSGVGIPQKDLGRVFDPFFTTKESGGDRFGASIVYGIIQKHQGAISVESKEENGTASPFVCRSRRRVKGRIRMIPSRILVADDDASHGNLEHVLSKEGYVVVPWKAVWLRSRSSKRGFDLVMTDLRMQPVDGMEVLRRAKELYPTSRSS